MGKKFRFIFLFCLSFVLLGSFVFIIYDATQYPVYYKAEILKHSYNFEIEPEIVASLIRVESSYRKDVVSNKGAVGLMQLLPSTATWISTQLKHEGFDEKMLFDVETNIMYGTFYIKYLIEKFDSLNVAVCAYNAGEGVVLNWLKNNNFSEDGKTLTNIPYTETNSHLQKFNTALKKYKKKYKNIKLKKVVSNNIFFNFYKKRLSY